MVDLFDRARQENILTPQLGGFQLTIKGDLMKKSLMWNAAAAALLIPVAAFAQVVSSTDVVVPIGNWVQAFFAFLDPIVPVVITGIVGWASRRFLSHYASAANTAAVEQVLNHAIRYAINVAVVNAPKNFSLPAHDTTIATAVQYVVDHAPARLIDFMGGKEAIAGKILARLNIAPAQP